MPISEEEIIRGLFKLLENERADRLTLIELLARQNIIDLANEELAVQIPSPMKLVGKKPWHMLQADLTERFRKKKATVQELTGIISEEENNNAG